MPHSASRARRAGATTLTIDVGGTLLKAAVLDAGGALRGGVVRARTPAPTTLDPPGLVAALVRLVRPLGAWDRVTVGFPGLVWRNVVYAFPISGDPAFRRFDLAGVLGGRLGAPVRVLNDAELQGRGAIAGEGIELVLTLGTSLGSALFIDGAIGPPVQLIPNPTEPAARGGPYGLAALRRLGRAEWSRRVARLALLVRRLTNCERLYIGGGNARLLALDAGEDVRIIGNESALVGGVRAWERGDA